MTGRLFEKVNILDVWIDNITRQEALEKVKEIIKKRKPVYSIWININQIVLYHEDRRFKNIVDRAELVLTDGKPIIWLSKLLHTPIKEKLGGSDFSIDMPNGCQRRV